MDTAVSYLTGVAVDPAARDQLYLVESGWFSVSRLAPGGARTPFAGTGEGGFADGPGNRARLAPVGGVAIAGSTLYVADTGNHRVRILELGDSASSTRARTLAGAPRLSAADGPGAQAGLVAPVGLALDARSGSLYVADSGNATIRRIEVGNTP